MTKYKQIKADNKEIGKHSIMKYASTGTPSPGYLRWKVFQTQGCCRHYFFLAWMHIDLVNHAHERGSNPYVFETHNHFEDQCNTATKRSFLFSNI